MTSSLGSRPAQEAADALRRGADGPVAHRFEAAQAPAPGAIASLFPGQRSQRAA